jgi:ketosteroid isomerase-like protein
MSQENVEVVRRIYDAFAGRDDATPFELYAEDIVWDVSNARRSALYAKTIYRGHEGVRQVWREALAVFGAVDFEVEELIDVGDRVLAVIHERETGRASGAPVEASHLTVWTLADGKVTRLQVFDRYRSPHARARRSTGCRPGWTHRCCSPPRAADF